MGEKGLEATRSDNKRNGRRIGRLTDNNEIRLDFGPKTSKTNPHSTLTLKMIVLGKGLGYGLG